MLGLKDMHRVRRVEGVVSSVGATPTRQLGRSSR
jgi:hypothetical protein